MIDISAFLTTCVLKSWELNITVSIIAYSFNHVTLAIFKYEAEFTSLQCTTFQFLREVEFNFHWNVNDTFFCWFFWFFNRFLSWIVLVNSLWSSVFDIYTIFSCCFDSCRDLKLVVTSECQLSSVDYWSVFCVSKWLSQVCLRSCSDHTIFNLDIKFSCHIFSCYRVVCFNFCYFDV